MKERNFILILLFEEEENFQLHLWSLSSYLLQLSTFGTSATKPTPIYQLVNKLRGGNCRLSSLRPYNYLYQKVITSFRCSKRAMEVNLVDSLLEARFVFVHGCINELVDVILQILQESSVIILLLSTRSHGWWIWSTCSRQFFILGFLWFHWF